MLRRAVVLLSLLCWGGAGRFCCPFFGGWVGVGVRELSVGRGVLLNVLVWVGFNGFWNIRGLLFNSVARIRGLLEGSLRALDHKRS